MSGEEQDGDAQSGGDSSAGDPSGSTSAGPWASPLETRFTQLTGARYPIVQTGMGWVSGARLTAATSAAGGLGILAAATMTLPELEAAIAKVKQRTDAPFGVNLRADQANVTDVVALIVREGVRLASFAGPPNKRVIGLLKDAGVLTMPTIGAPRHALKMASWGVDALIAQGGEGGGHTGSIPTSLLLPEVCRAVPHLPVLGAGGFKDGRGLVAALAYGADGIAMGTRFLLTAESHVPDAVKQTYLATDLMGTVVTTAIDGYPQRVVRTPVIDGLERSSWWARLWRAALNALAFQRTTGEPTTGLLREAWAMRRSGQLTLSQTLMGANAPMMTRACMVEGRQDVGILPTGQVTGAISELPAVAHVVQEIVAEAEATLARLCGGAGGPRA